MSDADPPEQLLHYRLGAELGRGGMARVFEATDLRDGSVWAMKLLAQHLSEDETFQDRFLTEAEMAKRVHHPRVVACREYGAKAGHLFMVMERCAGGDVQQHLYRSGGILATDEVLGYARDLAEALQAIYEQRLIHRDIKPGNCFIADDGHLKLGDLGLAHMTVLEQDVRLPIGTPAYCSPEQARGGNDVDIRTDIYAYGATLYRCLSGEFLFDAETPLEIIAKVLTQPLPDFAATMPQVSEPLRVFIRNCCHKQVDKRFLNPQAVLDALHNVEQNLQAARNTVTMVDQGANVLKGRVAKRAHIDPRQLTLLARMVVIEEHGLRAVIKLAPGAAFSREILDLILREADIRYGIQAAAITEATRPAECARRLVIALGDPPAPGVPGQNVSGDPMPALLRSVQIRISDDDMQVSALTRPGVAAERSELVEEIKQHGIRHGIRGSVIEHLTRDGDPSGYTLVAAGTPIQFGRPAGFGVQHQRQDGSTGFDLDRVQRGDVVAVWEAEIPVAPGMDVFGNRVDPPPLAQREASACVGLGVELRGRDGGLVLIAQHAGIVRVSDAGVVDIVGATEIDGDLDAASDPIECDELLIVRGNVAQGAHISAQGDVVICGDLADADVSAGGNLEVLGRVQCQDGELCIGGTLHAGSVGVGDVMAGSIRVDGDIHNARIHVTGDVEAHAIVGGCVIAGGSIRAQSLGDRNGTTTQLWCGRHLHVAQQRLLTELKKKHLAHERRQLIEAKQHLGKARESVDRRAMRLSTADVVDHSVQRQILGDRHNIEQRILALEQEGEALRHQLIDQHTTGQAMDERSAEALIEATRLAHPGVLAAAGDADPERLAEPQVRYQLKCIGG